MRFRKWRPSSAMVVAVLALFVSLGGCRIRGDAVAAQRRWDRAVAADAVTAAKLANKVVTSREALTIRSSQRTSGPGSCIRADRARRAPRDRKDPGAAGSTVNGVVAGGDLSGTYPNPSIGAGKVDATRLADGSVTSTKFGTPRHLGVNSRVCGRVVLR